MNKKVLLWIAGIFAVMVIALTAGGYFLLWRPIAELKPDLELIKTYPEINAEITEKAPYTPPADGELTTEQLERFARVQDSINAQIKNDPLLTERAEQLRGIKSSEDGVVVSNIGFGEALQLLKGLGEPMVRAKRAQVEALNREGFSLDEYRWVRERFYQALGFTDMQFYPGETLAKVLEREKSIEERPALPPTTENNRALAAKYSDRVEDWKKYYLLGL